MLNKNAVSVWRKGGERAQKIMMMIYTHRKHTQIKHNSKHEKGKNLFHNIFLDAATVPILLVSLFRSSEILFLQRTANVLSLELHENAHWLQREKKHEEKRNNNNKYISKQCWFIYSQWRHKTQFCSRCVSVLLIACMCVWVFLIVIWQIQEVSFNVPFVLAVNLIPKPQQYKRSNVPIVCALIRCVCVHKCPCWYVCARVSHSQ